MDKRVSHSVLDPWLTIPLKKRYCFLPIPRQFPPEGIVIAGHLFAIAAAFGFAYSTRFWRGGMLVAIGRLDLGLAEVICLYATAVLTSIKAKLVGEFTLNSFGPTKSKTLLVLYSLFIIASACLPGDRIGAFVIALWWFICLLSIGSLQLFVGLILAVRDVNTHG